MARELDGKVAVITGAASGIGRATAELFIAEGAKVVVADVNEEAGQQLSAELGDNALFMRTDVANPEELQALVNGAIDTFGGLHIMFNNAGISGAQYDRFLDDPFDDFDKVVGVNWLGVMKGAQFAGRHMAKNGGGVILNNASIAGLLAGHALMTYRTTKAAVIQLSKCMAIDLAEYGIRVNCLVPGHIRTPLNAYTEPGMTEAQSQKVRDALAPVWDANQPLKRHGSPPDVAQAALFLCSDRAAQITGITMPIDGGITAGDPVNHLRQIWDARAQALSDF